MSSDDYLINCIFQGIHLFCLNHLIGVKLSLMVSITDISLCGCSTSGWFSEGLCQPLPNKAAMPRFESLQQRGNNNPRKSLDLGRHQASNFCLVQLSLIWGLSLGSHPMSVVPYGKGWPPIFLIPCHCGATNVSHAIALWHRLFPVGMAQRTLAPLISEIEFLYHFQQAFQLWRPDGTLLLPSHVLAPSCLQGTRVRLSD